MYCLGELEDRSAKESEQEHEVLLEEWKKRILEEKLFEPRAVYGFFRCHNEDGKLSVDTSKWRKIVI